MSLLIDLIYSLRSFVLFFLGGALTGAALMFMLLYWLGKRTLSSQILVKDDFSE
jgi:hypothetical protein